MTDSGIQFQGQTQAAAAAAVMPVSQVAARRIGRHNWIGLQTLIGKECGRFLNVYMQTILAPMMSTLLFYAVFALAFGGSGRSVGDVPYMTFLAPGLVMMSMVQNAFANTSSSLMISKVQGNIVDLLMPPLSPAEILAGYIISGVIRGLVVGVVSLPAILLLGHVHVVSLAASMAFALLGTALLATIGIAAGLWAEKFDNLATITNFVILPMTFLSGTFYSMHSLPPTWQGIAHINPFFFLIDGFRYGLTGHAESNLWNGFGLLLVLNIGMLIFTYAMILTGYKTKQ